MAQHLISRLSSRDYWNLGARFTKTPPNGHPCLAEFDLNRIAKAIASRSAVLWVGAGFSMAAGAPSWAGLMRSLLDIVTKDQRPNDSEREWCQELQKTENFLQLADYLSNALGNTLHEHIQDLLPPSLKPTSLHYELSRIPFDVIITTNYDSLIENSFRTENAPRGRLSIFTWKQPDAFLLALRGAAAVGSRKHGLGRSLPLLMKLHGTIEDRSTIILSSAGYRDIQHRSQQLRETLKHLLLTRQFLFVGTSLNDPHLLGLLDETLAEYGRPHVTTMQSFQYLKFPLRGLRP